MSAFEAKYPMVRVEWEDSSRVNGWMNLKELLGRRYMRCVTVGFLVRDDEGEVIVVANFDGDEEWPEVSGGMVIPRSAVRKVEYLRRRPELDEGNDGGSELASPGVASGYSEPIVSFDYTTILPLGQHPQELGKQAASERRKPFWRTW
jgi:hypothetical protein